MPVYNEYRDRTLVYHHTLDEHPSPDFFFTHCHERYEILIVLSGKGFFCAEGRKYPLGKGRIYITRPGESHGIQISPEEPYHRVAYHWSPEFLNGCPAFFKEPFDSRRAGGCNEYLLKHTGSSGQLMVSVPDSAKGELLHTYLKTRLFAFLCDLSQVRQEAGDALTSTPASDKLSLAIDYVNSNLYGQITLEDVAAAAGLSTSQTCRLFKSRLGTTVHDFVQGKKVVAARQMILENVEPAEVGRLCGFGSYTAFYRAYYSYFGVSPTGVSRKKRESGLPDDKL